MCYRCLEKDTLLWPPCALSAAPSTSPTCGAWPSAGCPASSSTTPTAAPRTRSRCATTAASSTPSRSARATRVRHAARRSADHGPRHHLRSAVPARADRQHAHVLSARRGAGRGRGRRRRRRLHPVDAVRLAARGSEGRGDAAGLVSALSGRRPRRRARRHRARAQGRLLGAGRHHRHAGRRHARARSSQRHRRTADAQDRHRCCRTSRSCSRGRAGWRGSSPTAG